MERDVIFHPESGHIFHNVLRKDNSVNNFRAYILISALRSFETNKKLTYIFKTFQNINICLHIP